MFQPRYVFLGALRRTGKENACPDQRGSHSLVFAIVLDVPLVAADPAVLAVRETDAAGVIAIPFNS
jgi:hypothetical protein